MVPGTHYVEPLASFLWGFSQISFTYTSGSLPCHSHTVPTVLPTCSQWLQLSVEIPRAMASKPPVTLWQYLLLPPLPLLLTSCLSLIVQVLCCTQVVPLREDTALNAMPSASPGDDTVTGAEASGPLGLQLLLALQLLTKEGSMTPLKVFSEGGKGLSRTFLPCLGKKSKTASLSLSQIVWMKIIH